jgi:hypothetical protein
MSSLHDIIKIHGVCTADAFVLEKLHVMAAAQEVVAGFGE